MPTRSAALEDLHRFQLVGDAQISPDGNRIVFAVKRTDPEKNKYYTRLWISDAASASSRPFTSDGHSDSAPRWSPDGAQIAFISDREKPKSQIYLIRSDGGESRALTSLEEGGFKSLSWSPDGSRVAFLYRAIPEAYRKDAKKVREEKELSSPVRFHAKLFYRLDGTGYFDDAFHQVAVTDVATDETHILTDEKHHLDHLVWSPDGETLAFIADRREDEDLDGGRPDIWSISADGGEITQIPAPAGPKEALAWSPDGKWIAYSGHTDVDDTWGGTNERILVIPAAGSFDPRDLTGASDKPVGWLTLADMHEVGGCETIQWSPDSQVLYFPMSAFGDTRLYQVGLNGGGLTALTPADHELAAFSVSADERRFGIAMGSATELYDVYFGEPANGALTLNRASRVNEELLSEVELRMPEALELPNGDGGTVHGWLLQPTDFDANRKYPAIVYVHGGPAAQYGGQAAPFHELQWLAANGYVVLFSNPRGSKGYGEAHTKAIKGDWGNKDWQDIQTVADHGASLPYVEASRMAIVGGSYGGYMTAWAVGHTDRFACAIADRLVSNRHSMSGTCDFPWEHGKYWKGDAWDDPSDLWQASPLHYAGNIKTPLLLIHSDGDLRCPVGQAEELFAALRLQRKTVEFVRYPAESSHGLSRNGPPDLRTDRLRRNLEWLNRWLKR